MAEMKLDNEKVRSEKLYSVGYSQDFNSFILSFIPNAAISKATHPITPTMAIIALKLFLFASLQFQRKLKLK